MRRINLPLVLDTMFTALCAFLLFFTALRYYTHSVYIALGFAIAACVLFGGISFLYISKNQNKKLLVSRDEKQKKLLSLHLSLSSDSYILSLFKKTLEENGESPEIRGGKIQQNGKIYFFNCKMQALSEDDIARVIKYKTQLKKVLVCCKISPEAMQLCENFLIEIIGIDSIYKLLSDRKMLPEKYIYEGPKKITVFAKIKIRFNRKLCAPLFWSGLALLALSNFTFFPVYYIVSGGIMLILSVLSLVIN